jgi:hypothetical protein
MKRKESEGSKDKAKKIIMVKLIKQKEKKTPGTTISLFGKSSGVIPLVPNPGISVQAGALLWSHQVIGL